MNTNFAQCGGHMDASRSKPGPKAKKRAVPREPLPLEPPKELKLGTRAKAVYRMLAERLRAEGFCAASDARMVALAAQGAALAERMQEEVDGLESLVMPDGKLHPL